MADFQPDVTMPGGILWSPASNYAREITKFERTHTKYGPPGLPPYTHQDYPARLYRPSRDERTGRVTFEGATANDRQEQSTYEGQGYVAGGQGEALKALEQRELAIATAAAERAASERTMSERARTEAAAVDASTDLHVPVIPETPIRRGPGRPRKDEGYVAPE
jgi:hypothetical protein